MSVLKQIDDQIYALNRQLSQAYYMRVFVLEQLTVFDSLPDANLCAEKIDFDRLKHEQVMEVIKSFPGRWKKEAREDGRIDYSITLRNSSKTTDLCEIVIRCYAGEPPPNCKIVWEEVQVPACTVKKAKMICRETSLIPDVQEVPTIAETAEITEEIPF